MGLSAMVQSLLSTELEAGPDVPPLRGFCGKDTASVPTDAKQMLPGAWITIQEKKSVTLEIFIEHVEKVLIPFCARRTCLVAWRKVCERF